MITGGDQARLGFIDHSIGIEPRICTRDAIFCFEVEESAYTIICSVSTKLAALGGVSMNCGIVMFYL